MYKVQLDQFEGPLDLLLYFIKRDELDIYDIPISKITADYMETLQTEKHFAQRPLHPLQQKKYPQFFLL